MRAPAQPPADTTSGETATVDRTNVRSHESRTRERTFVRYAPSVAVAAIAVGVTVRNPHQPGSWGICPTYGLFGVYCPGCGTLRGMNDLTAGNVAESISHNALLIPGIAFIAYATIRGTIHKRWSYLWIAAFVTFTIARNIPGSPLAP